MKKIKSRKNKIKDKKVIKLVIMIILFVGVVGQIGDVRAGMNDSVIERNRVDGIYAVTTINGQQRIFYLNMYRMNGRPSYCIELGVDITTDIYHSTRDFSVSYLSNEQIEYIRSISYVGYEYSNHDDYRYYMAAQEIIWEYLSGVDVEWTNVLDVNGERIDITYYKNKVLEERDLFYKLPDFLWIDGRSYLSGGMIGLYDYNEILSGYEVVSSGHSSAIINGNNLQIEVAYDYIGEEEIILRKKNYYSYDSSLYYYDNSQRLISNGNFKEITKKLSFIVEGKTMKVQVVDSITKENVPMGQASLEGAVYEVYNENRELLGTYTTNLEGEFDVYNLSYGNYYFKQIKASEGYLLTDEDILVQFWQSDNKVILEQDVIFNVIELKKVYGSDGKYIPENGISFQILDWNGLIYEDIVTDENGISDIWLPYGTYTIIQNNTTFGYYKVDDFVVIVNEVRNGKVIYNLVNELIQCRVLVNTIEVDSGKQLLGEETVYRVKKKDDDNYIKFDGKSEFATNADGVLVFPMLFSYGDYILEQIDVAEGILINSKNLEFSIGEQTEFEIKNDELYIDIDVYNQVIMGKVEVSTKEEVFYYNLNDYGYNVESKAKVKLLLMANADIIVNGGVIYEVGDKIQEVITNENGVVIIDNLYLGDYCLVDFSTEEKKCFSLKSNSNKESVAYEKIEIISLLEKSDIYITNKDDLGQIIQGSLFEVYEKEGNVIYTGITNDEGMILIKDLVHGNYCIKQKKVSDKWLINSEDKCISLGDDQNIDFINKRQINKIWVPNTFSDGSDWIGFLIVNVIGLIGIGVILYKKIFAHY